MAFTNLDAKDILELARAEGRTKNVPLDHLTPEARKRLGPTARVTAVMPASKNTHVPVAASPGPRGQEAVTSTRPIRQLSYEERIQALEDQVTGLMGVVEKQARIIDNAMNAIYELGRSVGGYAAQEERVDGGQVVSKKWVAQSSNRVSVKLDPMVMTAGTTIKAGDAVTVGSDGLARPMTSEGRDTYDRLMRTFGHQVTK